jgi:hypothetical protein
MACHQNADPVRQGCAEAGEPAGLGGTCVPRPPTGGVEHRITVARRAMREAALARMEPNPLDQLASAATESPGLQAGSGTASLPPLCQPA